MPRLIGWILLQFAHLYQIESKLRQDKAGPALRAAVRAAQSVPIHRRLKKFLDKLALRRSILPKSLLGKAISYALGQWSRLEVYLTDGRVEIDNNWIENAIRPTKIGANYAKLRIMPKTGSSLATRGPGRSARSSTPSWKTAAALALSPATTSRMS